MGLVKHLLANNPHPQHVIATSRSLGGEKSKELEELAAKESCLSVVQLYSDVDDPATFPTAVGIYSGWDSTGTWTECSTEQCQDSHQEA